MNDFLNLIKTKVDKNLNGLGWFVATVKTHNIELKSNQSNETITINLQLNKLLTNRLMTNIYELQSYYFDGERAVPITKLKNLNKFYENRTTVQTSFDNLIQDEVDSIGLFLITIKNE